MRPDRLLHVSTTVESTSEVIPFPATVWRSRRLQLSTGHRAGVHLVESARSTSPDVVPFWAEPINPRRLVVSNGGSTPVRLPGHSYQLDGVPSRILGDHLSAPLQGLRVSRYPGGGALLDTPRGRGLHPASAAELSSSFPRTPIIPRITPVSMERVAPHYRDFCQAQDGPMRRAESQRLRRAVR